MAELGPRGVDLGQRRLRRGAARGASVFVNDRLLIHVNAPVPETRESAAMNSFARSRRTASRMRARRAPPPEELPSTEEHPCCATRPETRAAAAIAVVLVVAASLPHVVAAGPLASACGASGFIDLSTGMPARHEPFGLCHALCAADRRRGAR